MIGAIEDVCEESMQATKFFHGGPSRSDFRSVVLIVRIVLALNGVARSGE